MVDVVACLLEELHATLGYEPGTGPCQLAPGEVSVAGSSIPKDSKVMLLYAAANRDPQNRLGEVVEVAAVNASACTASPRSS